MEPSGQHPQSVARHGAPYRARHSSLILHSGCFIKHLMLFFCHVHVSETQVSLPTEFVELQNTRASSDFFPDVSEVLTASGCQQAFVHIPFHQHHHQWDTNGMVRFMTFNESESANPPTPSTKRADFHSKPFFLIIWWFLLRGAAAWT